MQKKYTLKIICLFSLLCILLTSCTGAKTLNFQHVIIDDNTSFELKTPSADNISVKKTDFAELLFDKKTFTVNVKDLQSNYVWQTLAATPQENVGALSLELYTKKGIYSLNTQDNSVKFGTARYEIKDSALTVNYVLSDNAETAKMKYENITKNDIYVSIAVTYDLKNQSLYVETDLSTVLCTPEAFIGKIEILPYLGTAKSDSSGDYFLIPDNSGAVMHLDKADENTSNIKISVYGQDPYLDEAEKSASATVPVFGVKRQNSAFAAIITNGDSLAEIIANRKTENKSSCIFARFNITPTSKISNRKLLYGNQYNGKLSIVYKFTANENAHYTAMASAAREEFIANGIMSSLKQDSDIKIPFYLTLIGREKSEALTTTDEAFEILRILKGKGINNINIIYKGVFTGNKGSKNIYTASKGVKLGGESGLEQLFKYTREQGCKLYLGADVISATSLTEGKASTITGKNSLYTKKSDMSFISADGRLITRIGTEASALGEEKQNSSIYSDTKDTSMKIRNVLSFQENFASFLESDIFDMCDGLALIDVGSILCQDAQTNREDAKKTIAGAVKATANYGDLTVEGGNIYTVYGAKLVNNMKFTTFYKENDAYKPVPFVQAILHGYTFYTGKPIDAGDPLYKCDMLQCIEYGALPGYQWIFENANIFYYNGYMHDDNVNTITDFYERASAVFSYLSDDTITNHREVTKDAEGKTVTGVYCTTYSDGTDIYVNYTSSIVITPENIAVGPYNFVAVKG